MTIVAPREQDANKKLKTVQNVRIRVMVGNIREGAGLTVLAETEYS